MGIPPDKITEKTITDIEKFKQKLDEIKSLGYYLKRSNVIEGIIGLGVAVRDFSGNVGAAIGVALPEFQMKEKDIKRAIGEMFNASQAISRKSVIMQRNRDEDEPLNAHLHHRSDGGYFTSSVNRLYTKSANDLSFM